MPCLPYKLEQEHAPADGLSTNFQLYPYVPLLLYDPHALEEEHAPADGLSTPNK